MEDASVNVGRNTVWGLLTTLWVAFGVGIAIGIVSIFSGDARDDVTEFGGVARLLGAYLAAAIPAGLVLGWLRPMGRSRVGRLVVGGAVTTVGFGTFLGLTLGSQFWGAVVFALPIMFVVGAAMAPFWYRGAKSGTLWIPNFDSFLTEVVHSPGSGTDNESE